MAAREGAGHGVFGDDGLTGPGRRGHEHRAISVQRGDGAALERIELEVVRKVTGDGTVSGTRTDVALAAFFRLRHPTTAPMPIEPKYRIVIGTNSASMLIGSWLGVITAAMTAMITIAGRHHPSNCRGVSTPMNCRATSKRELERGTEGQHHVQDQRDVFVGAYCVSMVSPARLLRKVTPGSA